jgi:hypothetical protein
MLRDYKIDFQQTQDVGWGKWNLISVIYYMKKDSPISEPNPLLPTATIGDKKNLAHKRRKFEESLSQDSVTRFYLTQREITSGAVKVKPGFYDLGDSIEVELLDVKQKKSYLVYYYKDVHLLLGFKEIFERYKALQGSIITFEMSEDPRTEGQLQFTIRTTKKGTISDRIEYIPEEKAWKVSEEKFASPVFVNKSMFLEASVFHTLYDNLNFYRNISTFNKLVHKIFLDFGVKERNYEIQILRLYHIIDLVYPSEMKLVEEVILSNPEFVPAEKLAGVFYLDSDAVVEIEEEEVKRKETQADEIKKKREELRQKKLDQERKIKEEIRQKREDRRKKREDEMWEKERIKQVHTDVEPPTAAPSKAAKPERSKPVETTTRKPIKKKESSPEPGFTKQPPAKEETVTKKEHPRRTKKKTEDEKNLPKVPKRSDRKPEVDSMSEDDIKSQIELEKLKEKMGERKKPKKKAKKKEIAYKDKDSSFGGIFASKLDEFVKKDSEKEKK